MKYFILLLIVLFTTSLDLYLNKSGVVPLKPSAFFIPLFFLFSLLSYKPTDYFIVFKTHTFKMLLLFFILSIIYSLNTDTTREFLLIDIVNRLITLFLYVFSVLFFENNKSKTTKIMFIISVVVLGLSIWYDTFFNLEYGIKILRKGGFAENPNVGASALKFLGIPLLLLVNNNKLKLIIFFGILATVFITFSRSGLISLFLIMILMLINEWQPTFNFNAKTLLTTISKTIAILFLSYVVIFNIAKFIQSEIPSFAEGDAGDRIDMLLGEKENNSTFMNADDVSQGGRSSVAKNYLKKFMINPFGYGTGYTSDVTINFTDTHNYYLTVGINYGFIGLLTLFWFIIKSFRLSIINNNYYYFVFICLFCFECFISNGVLSEKALVIVIAFMDQKLYTINHQNN